jgi:hypothetical protein
MRNDWMRLFCFSLDASVEAVWSPSIRVLGTQCHGRTALMIQTIFPDISGLLCVFNVLALRGKRVTASKMQEFIIELHLKSFS